MKNLKPEDTELFLRAFKEGTDFLFRKSEKEDLKLNDSELFLSAVNQSFVNFENKDLQKPIQKYKKIQKSKKSDLAILDLHGMYEEDALASLHSFLLEHKRKGKKLVLIIHGKGAGILRGAVHNALKSHEYVSDYTIAPSKLGGDGALLVWIKKK